MPGFIDTRVDIELSLVNPVEFDRCGLPRGVTTVICDPHKIANVLSRKENHAMTPCSILLAGKGMSG